MSSFTSRMGIFACLAAVAIAALAETSRATVAPSEDASPNGVTIAGKPGPPMLVFASGAPASELEGSLADPNVIADLVALKAGIAMALPDLNSDRASLVRKLNEQQIPATAWLTLPREQGYYPNADNASASRTRFLEFQRWSTANGLRWAAVGLDIEPNIQEFAMLRNSKLRLAGELVRRYFELGRVRRATESYTTLIKEIQSYGYVAETYQFPFIADERQERSSLLERLGGLVDVRGDREVLMLYSSFNPAIDSALIWVYGPDAQAIAVGSTAGSDLDSRFRPLGWDEFSRDLLVAHHFSSVIGVYNLEGCIRQGFLPRLRTLDWQQKVVIPAESIRKAELLRTRIQRAIWVVSYLPVLILTFAVGIVVAIGVLRKRRMSSSTSIQPLS